MKRILALLIFSALAFATEQTTAVNPSVSATPTFTADSGNTIFRYVLAQNVTTSTFVSAHPGTYVFRICQPSSGGTYTYTFAPFTSSVGMATVPTGLGACLDQAASWDGTTLRFLQGGSDFPNGISTGAGALKISSHTGSCPSIADTGYDYTICRESNQLYSVSSASVKTPIAGDVYGPGSATPGHLAVYGSDPNHLEDGGAVPSGGSGGSHQWFPAATCGNGGANLALWDMKSDAPNGFTCGYFGTSAGPMLGTMQFVASPDHYAYLAVQLPASFTTVSVTLKVWRGSTSSGSTRYVLEGRCMADGDTGSTTFPNSATLTDGAGADYSLQTFGFTSFPVVGCSGGNVLLLQLHRDTTCGGCSGGNMADISYFKGAQVDIQ